MLQKDIKWYFPEKLEELPAILSEDKALAFHAGGTAILRVKSASISGLIDLGKLGLDYVKKDGDKVRIGAMSSMNAVLDSTVSSASSFKMLQSAIELAAAAPIRNRITIGGSIGDLPVWSDIISTLLCLDAEVVYCTENGSEKSDSLASFVAAKKHKERNLIKELVITEKEIGYSVKKLMRVNFDYAIFNIAVALTMDGSKVADASIYISGVKDQFKQLSSVEKALKGQELTSDSAAAAAEKISVEFRSDFVAGAEYKERVAKTYLKDCLTEIAGA